MADDDGNDIMGTPSAYVAFPLAILVFVILIFLVRFLRRRSRHSLIIPAEGMTPEWPRDRANMYTQPNPAARGRRTTFVHTTTHSPQEGLDEFGEAPPPYDGKKEGGSDFQETELRNLEAGMARPPRYPAEPPATVPRYGRTT